MNNGRINWVCKTCGRAVRSFEKPSFCYYDRTMAIENISDVDSVKMGLFSEAKGVEIALPTQDMLFEFIGDVRYNPLTGEELNLHFPTTLSTGITSLKEFQNKIMEKVITNE